MLAGMSAPGAVHPRAGRDIAVLARLKGRERARARSSAYVCTGGRRAGKTVNPIAFTLIWVGVIGFIGMVGYASEGGPAWVFAAVILACVAFMIRWR